MTVWAAWSGGSCARWRLALIWKDKVAIIIADIVAVLPADISNVGYRGVLMSESI